MKLNMIKQHQGGEGADLNDHAINPVQYNISTVVKNTAAVKKAGENGTNLMAKTNTKHQDPIMERIEVNRFTASVPYMGQDDFKEPRQFFGTEIKWKSICGICCSVSKHKSYLYICVQETKFYSLRNFFFPKCSALRCLLILNQLTGKGLIELFIDDQSRHSIPLSTNLVMTKALSLYVELQKKGTNLLQGLV